MLNPVYIAILLSICMHIFACSDSRFASEQRPQATQVSENGRVNSQDGSVEAKVPTKTEPPAKVPDQETPIDEETGENPEEEPEETPPEYPCEPPSGSPLTQKTLQIEDWPGNTVDPGGADYNDVVVVLKGTLLVEHEKVWEIGFGEGRQFEFEYTKLPISKSGTECDHAFTFNFRRCPDRNAEIVSTDTLDASGRSFASKSINVPDPYVYLEIILTTIQTNKQYCPGTRKKNFSIFDLDTKLRPAKPE